MNCPICEKKIQDEKISITVTIDYEPYEYAGLFGGKAESGLYMKGRAKTGKYHCPCGCIIDLLYQGNTNEYMIGKYEFDEMLGYGATHRS